MSLVLAILLLWVVTPLVMGYMSDLAKHLDPTKPIAIVAVLVVAGINLLVIRQAATGDFMSEARLMLVTFTTWLLLSIVAGAISVIAGTAPPLPPTRLPDPVNTATRILLGCQLPLLALVFSAFFKASPNNANQLRKTEREARNTLAALRGRYNPRDDTESQRDTADWNRLLQLLDKIAADGKALPLALKCPAEAKKAEDLVANATLLSAKINGHVVPLRNRILAAASGGDETTARDFFR